MAIICVMVFIAGWTMRGVYLPTQDSNLNLSPVFKKKSSDKTLDLLDVSHKVLNSEEKKVIHKNLESQDDFQNNESSLKVLHESNIRMKKLEQDEEIVNKQKKHDAMNRKHLLSIPNNKTFILKGEYSFLVNVFSEEKKALAYIEKLRRKYPMWNFFLKFHKNGVKIYLGAFETKQKAKKFINTVSKKKLSFPNYFLEKQSL